MLDSTWTQLISGNQIQLPSKFEPTQNHNEGYALEDITVQRVVFSITKDSLEECPAGKYCDINTPAADGTDECPAGLKYTAGSMTLILCPMGYYCTVRCNSC